MRSRQQLQLQQHHQDRDTGYDTPSDRRDLGFSSDRDAGEFDFRRLSGPYADRRRVWCPHADAERRQ